MNTSISIDFHLKNFLELVVERVFSEAKPNHILVSKKGKTNNSLNFFNQFSSNLLVKQGINVCEKQHLQWKIEFSVLNKISRRFQII